MITPIPNEDHVAINACDEIAEVCQPLTQLFNINYFSYHRYYLSGKHEDIYLTRQEITCLVYFFKGLNYPRIGQKLNICQITVQRHFDAIRKKFNCHSRNELKDLLKDTEFNLLVKQIEYEEQVINKQKNLDTHYILQHPVNFSVGTD